MKHKTGNSAFKTKNYQIFGLIFGLASVTTLLVAILFISNVREAYKKDVDLLLSIAQALGYSTENKIGFERSYAVLGGDTVRLVFYSNISRQQIDEQIQMMGLRTIRYVEDDPNLNQVFIRGAAWLENSENTLTYNGARTSLELLRVGYPLVREWELIKATNVILIRQGNRRNSSDIWKLSDEELASDIVVIKLYRDFRISSLILKGIEEYRQNP